MQHALYPQTAEQLAVACPYCGGPDLQDTGRDQDASHCEVRYVCGDCGRVHHISYTATEIALESTDDPSELVVFNLPVAVLEDQGAEEPARAGKLPVGVVPARDGLGVVAHGYGDYCAGRGDGSPLILELFRGRLRAIAWHDINDDDGTTVVDLDQAREDEREVDPEYRYEARRCDRTGTVIEGDLFSTVEGAIEHARTRLANVAGHEAVVVELGAPENPQRWSSRDKNERRTKCAAGPKT